MICPECSRETRLLVRADSGPVVCAACAGIDMPQLMLRSMLQIVPSMSDRPLLRGGAHARRAARPRHLPGLHSVTYETVVKQDGDVVFYATPSMCSGRVRLDAAADPGGTQDVTTRFVQARNYTPAGGRRIDLIVLHTMEAPEKGDTAETIAAWFAGPSAPQASAHYCIDDNTVVQCVRDADVAWHAPGVNHNGIGLEHAGYARQTSADWADPYSKAMLELSADLAAAKCRAYGIPALYVDAAGLRAGKRGITTHLQASLAFTPGGHTDPGPAFPIGWYCGRVRHLAKVGGVHSPPMTTVEPLLHLGATGNDVRRAQKLLGVPADGVFGTATRKAVQAFQAAHALARDGVVGPATWAALLAARR